MSIRILRSLPPALALLLVAGATSELQASGFQLREQSPASQGNAFAGVTAKGFDISAMFFNPATMAQFKDSQVVVGFSYVAPKAEMSGLSASRANYAGPLAALAPFGGTAINGPSAHPDAAQDAALPNIYAMWALDETVKLGLSVNAPFGLVTDYNSDFAGRYHALKSDLKTMDVALNMSYQFHPKWALGVSLIHRSVEAELSNAVDFGQIAFLGLATTGNMAAAMNFRPTGTAAPFDGKATVKGTASLPAYKLGLTYQPLSNLTFGVAYQGASTPHVKGTVHYDYPTISAAPLNAAFQAVIANGKIVNAPVDARVTLPDTASLGISWDVTPTFNLGFEAARTGWSAFKELRIKFSSGQSDSVTQEKWHNTMYYALGASWKATNAWTVRFGVATDEGAVDDAHRTPRIPDSDRTWFSAGASYAFSRALSLDFAYTHILVKDSTIALTAPMGSPDFLRGNLNASINSSIDIAALSLRYSF